MQLVAHFNLLLLLVFGVGWAEVILFLRKIQKKEFVYILFFTVFYIYLFKVLDYTLLQFQSLLLLKLFVPNLMLNGQAAGDELNLVPLISLTASDVQTSLLNILLFVPFGYGLSFITDFRAQKIILSGIIFSMVIELLQFITGRVADVTFRVADINDVIFNTIGVVIGYVLFIGFIYLWRRLPSSNTFITNPIAHYIDTRTKSAANNLVANPGRRNV